MGLNIDNICSIFNEPNEIRKHCLKEWLGNDWESSFLSENEILSNFKPDFLFLVVTSDLGKSSWNSARTRNSWRLHWSARPASTVKPRNVTSDSKRTQKQRSQSKFISSGADICWYSRVSVSGNPVRLTRPLGRVSLSGIYPDWLWNPG